MTPKEMAVKMIKDGALFVIEECKPHYEKPKISIEDFDGDEAAFLAHEDEHEDDHYPTRTGFTEKVEEEINRILEAL